MLPYTPLATDPVSVTMPPQLLVVGAKRDIDRPRVAIQWLIAGARRRQHRQKHHDQCELPRGMCDRQTHPPPHLGGAAVERMPPVIPIMRG